MEKRFKKIDLNGADSNPEILPLMKEMEMKRKEGLIWVAIRNGHVLTNYPEKWEEYNRLQKIRLGL